MITNGRSDGIFQSIWDDCLDRVSIVYIYIFDSSKSADGSIRLRSVWITSMLPASFTKFVSSRNLKVSVLLACSNKDAASSSAEEGSDDELSFLVVSLYLFVKTYLLMNKNC